MRGRLVKPLLVCVFALAFAGCGSEEGTIPEGEAEDLLSVLATMQSQIEEGDCEFVDENATEFVSRVNNLPSDVDPEVASELTQAADNLRVLASQPDQCTETGATGLTGTTTDTTDTETTVTETTTPEEETTTEEPAEEEPAEEPPAPEGGNQGGNEGGGQGGDGAPAPDEDLEPPGGTGGVEPSGKRG